MTEAINSLGLWMLIEITVVGVLMVAGLVIDEIGRDKGGALLPDSGPPDVMRKKDRTVAARAPKNTSGR